MTTDLSTESSPAEGSQTAVKGSERQNREPKLPRPVKAKAPPKPKPEPIPYRPTSNPGEDEQTAVHEVYEAIAPHFSQTRHKVRLTPACQGDLKLTQKPWPLISTFLHSLPPNSVGLDSGGGNGKYVPTAREAGVGLVVMDRSLGLLGDARRQPGFGLGKGKGKGKGREVEGDVAAYEVAGSDGSGECVRGDLTCEGWRRGVFDFAISIAAIHHLSTPLRRRRAVQVLLQPLVHAPKPPYARFMIYVWAYEQSSGSKRRMGATTGPPVPLTAETAARESAGTGEQEPAKVQDVLVPWVLQPPKAPRTPSTGESSGAAQSDEPVQVPAPEPQVLHRYYHLFVQGELRDLVVSAAKEDGYRVLGSTEGESGETEDESASEPLSSDTRWIKIRGVGWEADNWWIEGEVGIRPVSLPPV